MEKIRSKHPCDTCEYADSYCPYPCIFESYNSAECENYECKYCDSDIPCEFANRCGAYKGNQKPDLEYDYMDAEED